LGSWTIIPVEHASSKQLLERKEKEWKHRFRNNIINDPTIWKLKPTRKSKKEKKEKKDEAKKPQRVSQQKRIEDRKLMTSALRRKVSTVLHSKDENWRKWETTTLLDLLIHINVAKIPKSEAKQVFFRIKPLIWKRTQGRLNIRREYIIPVMHCPNKNFKKDLTRELRVIIEESLKELDTRSSV